MSILVGILYFAYGNAKRGTSTFPRVASQSNMIRPVELELARVGSRNIELPKVIHAATNPELRQVVCYNVKQSHSKLDNSPCYNISALCHVANLSTIANGVCDLEENKYKVLLFGPRPIGR